MLYDVLTQIIKDLKIYKIPNESDKEYFARVIYSAVSVWIRVSTFNNDSVSEEYGQIGVNKHRNTIENRKVLEGLLELVPESADWFETLKREDIIPTIRERLENIGEIISKDKKLVLPSKVSSIYQNKINRSDVINGRFDDGFISGIVWFQNIEKFDSMKLDYITNDSPTIFIDQIVNNSDWSKIPSNYDYEVFDPYSQFSFHQSWAENNLIKDKEIYLARHRLESSLYDYLLVKKSGDILVCSELDTYFRDNFEIYRLYYGLCQKKGNYHTVNVKLYQNVGVISLNNRLPNFEQNILRSICWPKNNIIDDYTYVFSIEVFPLIESTISRLNIKVRRVE